MVDTLLVITGLDIPPYAARGLTQTLEPIPAAQNFRRTVNATLKNTAAAQFQKYKSQITCSDSVTPAFDGIFPGLIVTVDCVYELSYRTAGGSPQRPIVDGSSRSEGDFTFYRPRLEMMVIQTTGSEDDWGAATSWSIDLEEV